MSVPDKLVQVQQKKRPGQGQFGPFPFHPTASAYPPSTGIMAGTTRQRTPVPARVHRQHGRRCDIKNGGKEFLTQRAQPIRAVHRGRGRPALAPLGGSHVRRLLSPIHPNNVYSRAEKKKNGIRTAPEEVSPGNHPPPPPPSCPPPPSSPPPRPPRGFVGTPLRIGAFFFDWYR